MGDHLRQQGVEGRVRLVAGVAAAVDPHARSARRLVGSEYAAGRAHGAVGVQGLQIDPRLDREAARTDGFRRPEPETCERLAGRDSQLCLDEVDACDRLGDRVLDLEAGVRLDEREAACPGGRAAAVAGVAAPSGKGEELERAQTVVLRGAAEAQRGVDDRGPQVGAEVGRRRRLDHLLVPPLGAALAFAEVDQPAGFVTQELDFDVPRPRDQLLDVEAAVAERALCLGPAALVGLFDLVGRSDDAGPAAAAAGERLDDHRLALAQGGEELLRFFDRRRPIRAAQHRYVRAGRHRTRSALVAEEFQHLGPRADEGDARVGAGGCEVRVLGQEAVAGMDRVAVRIHRPPDDTFDVEVRGHAAAIQGDRLVGDPQVESVRVVLGVHRDGVDAKIHRRAGDAHRDFAAVCDQQTAHGLRRRVVSWFRRRRLRARSVGCHRANANCSARSRHSRSTFSRTGSAVV